MTATPRSQHDQEYRQAWARVVLSCVALTVCLATPDELIRQADAALYAAKRRGRNRVEESASLAAI